MRRGLSQVQWIAIAATGLLIGIIILWGVYSGIVDDVVGTLGDLFGAGSEGPDRVDDPFNNTAGPGADERPRHVDIPVSRQVPEVT